MTSNTDQLCCHHSQRSRNDHQRTTLAHCTMQDRLKTQSHYDHHQSATVPPHNTQEYMEDD